MSALFLLGLVGCSDQGFQTVADYGGIYDASIHGRVCDPTRNIWLEGATVYTHILTPDGELVGTAQTITDANGYYTLADLREDTDYTVYVQYGSAILDMFDVSIGTEQEVQVPEPTCSSRVDGGVAVVSGDFDHLDTLLPEFGVAEPYVVNGQTGGELVQFLQSTANLAQFKAVFFSGGHIEEDVIYDTDGSDVNGVVPRVLEAVRAYVDGGGTLVATDWSYDVVEQAWPEALDFLGDDGTPNAAQLGTPGTVNARVTDVDLAEAVGAGTVAVSFDLDTWPVVTGGDAAVTVYQLGDAPYRVGLDTGVQGNSPFLVRYPVGKGQVFFTTWRLTANREGDGGLVISFLLDQL